jgi:two-component system, NtrC family, response regulator AtoC
LANVLIVEDETELAGTLAEVLRAAGHQVRTASGGAPALALAHDSPPDLLISDWALGSPPDGLELVEQMRVARPQLAVILMTAYASETLRAWSEAHPQWGLLEKPFSLSGFRELVSRVLGVTTRA